MVLEQDVVDQSTGSVVERRPARSAGRAASAAAGSCVAWSACQSASASRWRLIAFCSGSASELRGR